MNNVLKIGLYVALTIGALVFANLFYKTYKTLGVNNTGDQDDVLENVVSTNSSKAHPAKAQSRPATNAIANASTNLPATNVTAVVTNQLAAVAGTNSTNHAEPPSTPQSPTAAEPRVERALGAGTGRGRNFGPLVSYTGGFLLMVIGLGLMVANDLTHYISGRAVKVLYNDEGEGLKTPEYELAEQTWVDGHYLEAIRMLRDYLNANPREIHAAIRIAEIYEKDLQNPLAAALEYEEILKIRLQPERWSWAAIHLCNLYFKLGQNGKAAQLLKRIDSDHPQTQGADKARKKLAQMDADGTLPPDIELSSAPPPPAPVEENPGSKLPPGFGRRKG